MSPLELSVIGLVVVAAILLWMVARLTARLEALRKLVSEEWSQLLAAQQALKQLAGHRLDERMEALEDRLDAVAEEQQQILMRDQAIVSYADAIRQARHGASVEELMTAHQLGRSEAELIIRLHAQPESS